MLKCSIHTAACTISQTHMKTLEKYLTSITAIIGILTISLGLVILIVMPQSANLSEGFRTPIIALEFAQSEDDLAFLTDADADGPTNRDKIDQGHKWDMAFPVAYGLFLALLLVQLAQSGFQPAWAFVPLALLAIPFDIWENTILIEITDILRNGGAAGHLLGRLQVATWLKWCAIGICAGAVGVGSWGKGELWSAGLGILTLIMTAVCWLLDSDPVCVEVMALLVFLFFLWFVVKQCYEYFLKRM